MRGVRTSQMQLKMRTGGASHGAEQSRGSTDRRSTPRAAWAKARGLNPIDPTPSLKYSSPDAPPRRTEKRTPARGGRARGGTASLRVGTGPDPRGAEAAAPRRQRARAHARPGPPPPRQPAGHVACICRRWPRRIKAVPPHRPRLPLGSPRPEVALLLKPGERARRAWLRSRRRPVDRYCGRCCCCGCCCPPQPPSRSFGARGASSCPAG